MHRRVLMLSAGSIDFDLSPAEHIELAAHLAACADCRHSAEVLRREADALRLRQRANPPAGMRQRVSVEWSRGGPRSSVGSVRMLLVAATFMLVIVGGALVGGASREQPSPAPSAQKAIATPLNAAPSLPAIGAARFVPIPAGAAAHVHRCHVIVESDCAAAITISGDTIWTTTSTGIVPIDWTSGVIGTPVEIGPFPHELVVAPDGSIWAGFGSSPSRIVRIDPQTYSVVAIPELDEAGSLTFESSGLWAITGTGRMDHLDPRSGRRLGTVSFEKVPWGIADVDGSLWVVDRRGTTLWRVDPRTESITETIDLTISGAALDEDSVGAIFAAFGQIWVTGHASVVRYDPSSGATSVRPLVTEARLIIGSDVIWAIGAVNKILARLDPETLEVVARQTLAVPGGVPGWDLPGELDGDGNIWIRDYAGDQLIAITPDP